MKPDAAALHEFMTAERREFHRHPESAFTEFWTASRIAGFLAREGYEVQVGRQIMDPRFRMGVPDEGILEACRQRALDEGADPAFVERMRGGFTAVAGILRNGSGPVLGFRFDMDAVDVRESEDPDHLPRKLGFASMHEGVMHACGHDAHIVTGLALARILASHRGSWGGTVKLIFQPAEEGVRGARSIAESGFLDDVDFMIAGHVGIVPDGSRTFYSRVSGFLSTTKLDFHFTGRAAHAGVNPELGRSAVLAAAATALQIQGIPRHSAGASRVNIGKISGGTGRNVIPEHAFLALETRGQTSEINDFMAAEAVRIAEGVGQAYGVQVRIEKMGEASDARSDPDLSKIAAACALEAGYERAVEEPLPLGGSEDFSFMMNRVEARGGKALYVVLGTELSDAHHAPRFDLREKDLPLGALTFALLARRLSKGDTGDR
ncbi:MAG: M20 family metallo-hydrolase [Treponema sp.]|nr:M20 family metallo-hydrolase [Treponema sp.]